MKLKKFPVPSGQRTEYGGGVTLLQNVGCRVPFEGYVPSSGESYSTSTNLLHSGLQGSLESANSTFDAQVQTANLTAATAGANRTFDLAALSSRVGYAVRTGESSAQADYESSASTTVATSVANSTANYYAVYEGDSYMSNYSDDYSYFASQVNLVG